MDFDNLSGRILLIQLFLTCKEFPKASTSRLRFDVLPKYVPLSRAGSVVSIDSNFKDWRQKSYEIRLDTEG